MLFLGGFAKVPRHWPKVVVGVKSPYPTVVVVVKTHLGITAGQFAHQNWS